MKKLIKISLLAAAIALALVLVVFCYFFVGSARQSKNITWGVNFSQMQAESLKLDWKETYSAILDGLSVKNIKLLTQWDWVEGEKDYYFFDDIDWQINQAQKNNAKIIYVIGMKTGRWPECHIPQWAQGLSKEEQQAEIMKYVKEVVSRYKGRNVIAAWQVENEPLFVFGQCPWYDEDFLKKEVKLVKSLDNTRPVIVSDSGELSSWFSVAKIGDIVGTTIYRKSWVHIINGFGFYGTFPIPPVFYWRKTLLMEKLFNKKVICVELQEEPWAQRPFYDVSIEEQEKTMNINQFKKNIEYAKNTGLDTFYLWGSEWWYWMKETQSRPEIWNEAKKLFAD